jgi:TolA-binding protein
LHRTLAGVISQRQESDDEKITEAEARATVAQVNPNDLQQKLDQIQTQVLRMENLAKSEDQKIQFLEERLKQLNDESAVLGKGKVQAVRFPRERKRNVSPFPIIVRHGQVYPLVIGPSLRPNDALNKNTISEGDAIRVEPIKGKGMTLPGSRATLSETLKAAAAEKTYISIYLYSDSFGVFQDLKNAIIDAKISYGLEFMENGSPLTFSSDGSSPPEL